MIGYLLCIFLATAGADSDCIAGIASLVKKKGENLTFSIDHITNSGKEYDVTVDLNGTLVAGLTCKAICNINNKKHGILLEYNKGTLVKMNANRLDSGMYKIHYFGDSLEKDKTIKCVDVTVDDDKLASTVSPDPLPINPFTTPAVGTGLQHMEIIAWVAGVVISAAVLFLIVFNYWWCKKA